MTAWPCLERAAWIGAHGQLKAESRSSPALHCFCWFPCWTLRDHLDLAFAWEAAEVSDCIGRRTFHERFAYGYDLKTSYSNGCLGETPPYSDLK